MRIQQTKYISTDFTLDQRGVNLVHNIHSESGSIVGGAVAPVRYDCLDDTIAILSAIRNARKLNTEIEQLYRLTGYHPSTEGVIGVKCTIKDSKRHPNALGLMVLYDPCDRKHPYTFGTPIGHVVTPIDEDVLEVFPPVPTRDYLCHHCSYVKKIQLPVERKSYICECGTLYDL